MKQVFYWDMDGVLADFHTAYAQDRAVALKREAMANLKPFQHNVDLLNSLMAQGITCYILTKAANTDGAQGKIDWLTKYVPTMDADHIIIINKGRKVDNIREAGVLIDDDMTNCKQWNKAGYTSIYLANKGQEVEL